MLRLISLSPGVFVAQALEGSARLMLVSGVRHLDPQKAVVEAMLAGWARQQLARLLADNTITAKVQAVRRFAAFTNDYPWVWTPADIEEFWARLPGRVLTAVGALPPRDLELARPNAPYPPSSPT